MDVDIERKPDVTVTNKATPKGKQPVVRKRKNKTEKENVEHEDEVPAKKVKVEKCKIKSEGGGKSKKIKAEVSTSDTPAVSWKADEVISACIDIPVWAAKNVVKLLDEGCTIPFIARYRKEQTGGMEVEKLRETLTMLEDLRFDFN